MFQFHLFATDLGKCVRARQEVLKSASAQNVRGQKERKKKEKKKKKGSPPWPWLCHNTPTPAGTPKLH